jgi:hypothetical protein
MGFLRRLLGGESSSPPDERQPPEDAASAEADERARDLELLREEQDRLGDLARRQLRYADYAWEPPAQGGERRADDADKGTGGGET